MEIVLPQLAESITEAIIGKWLAVEGQEIDKYQPLVEVITDKVNVEMPSPVSGRLVKIIAAEGETILVGSVLADIKTSEEGKGKLQSPPPSSNLDTLGGFISGAPPVGPTGAANVPQNDESKESTVAQDASEKTAKLKLSPAVKKLVEKHNVDVGELSGTGKFGRVTRKDVQLYLHSTQGTNLDETDDNDTKIRMDPIRKITAKNMSLSAAEIPDAWLTIEADITDLVLLRQSIKQSFYSSNSFHITYLAFAVYAACKAIQTHPVINASFKNDEIVLHADLNIGIAVAGPSGLIVPVIKNVVDKSITSIAHEIDRLIDKVNSGKLTHSDVTHGTFTVNNTGALGSNLSIPIIVPGQASILTTELVTKKPVVVQADVNRASTQTVLDGEHAIEIRSMMNLCLSFDHRIMDGVEAAGFLNDVKQNMESFSSGTSLV